MVQTAEIGLSPKCRLFIWATGGVLLVCAGVVLFAIAIGEETSAEFRLETVKEINRGATNIIVFRLTSLDSQGAYLVRPGSISVPSPVGRWNPGLGNWAYIKCPPAECISNFIPAHFKKELEFSIVVPTNQVWRLYVQPLRDLSRLSVWGWKTRRAWESLKGGNFSAIPGAWTGPWAVTFNYAAWSAPFTNRSD